MKRFNSIFRKQSFTFAQCGFNRITCSISTRALLSSVKAIYVFARPYNAI